MRLWIASLVSCVACAPAPATPIAQDANALVREMASHYHALQTYADRGKVTVTVTSAGTTQTESHEFATAYVRAARVRFAFDQSAADPFELWTDRTHTYVVAKSLDHIVDFETHLDTALGALAEASHGVTRRALWNLEHDPQAHGPLAIAASDAETWHLTGKDEELFIDRRSLLLARVIEHHHFAPTPSRPVAGDPPGGPRES